MKKGQAKTDPYAKKLYNFGTTCKRNLVIYNRVLNAILGT